MKKELSTKEINDGFNQLLNDIDILNEEENKLPVSFGNAILILPAMLLMSLFFLPDVKIATGIIIGVLFIVIIILSIIPSGLLIYYLLKKIILKRSKNLKNVSNHILFDLININFNSNDKKSKNYLEVLLFNSKRAIKFYNVINSLNSKQLYVIVNKLKELNKLELLSIEHILSSNKEKEFIKKLKEDKDYLDVMKLILSDNVKNQDTVFQLMRNQILIYLESEKNDCNEILKNLFSKVDDFRKEYMFYKENPNDFFNKMNNKIEFVKF